MRRLVVITDKEPQVKYLWSQWEISSARIEGAAFTAKLRDGSTFTVESSDPQLVADIVM